MWYVSAEGNVDFRISLKEFQLMKGDFPECREERSIEELVRKAEKDMMKLYLNESQQEWFEEYVS